MIVFEIVFPQLKFELLLILLVFIIFNEVKRYLEWALIGDFNPGISHPWTKMAIVIDR